MARSRPAMQHAAKRAALVALVGAAGLAVGCRRDPPGDEPGDDVAFVSDGSDTAAVETDAQLVTSSLVSASPGSLGLASSDLAGADVGARTIGDGARAIYFPRGCLTVTSDPDARTATYTFDRCMGPNGLRNVTGVVTVRYRAEPEMLHLDLTATDLVVNRATVDWAAAADIRASGAARTMTWKAQLSGTTAAGRPFRRTSAHTTSWLLGEPCFALDGTSEGEVNEREIRTEITDFKRCRRACPDAGGRIVVTNVTRNKRYELRYDGTNRATFIGPNGKEASIPLPCGQ